MKYSLLEVKKLLMSNGEASYTNAQGLSLKLFIDVDLKSETIQDIYSKGELKDKYALELEELKSLALNQKIKKAFGLLRSQLSNELLLAKDERAAASLTLWLLHHALEDYLGLDNTLREERDLLCLCYGVGVSELKKQILSRNDYELSHLVAETGATSACGSCKTSISLFFKTIREEHGKIEGLTHAQSRLDKSGHWLKIKGLYPSELVLKLDDLKNQWMKREGIVGQFEIEIQKIEGYHLWLSVSPNEDAHRSLKVLEALSDYWKSELGALFFLHLI